MIDPAILKAEFQGTHIPGGNQLPGLHAQVRQDLLHHLVAVTHGLAARGAERQVVGPERGAGEAKAQGGLAGEPAEGMAPGRGLRFLRIEAQVVHLVGDGQPGAQGVSGPLLLQPLPVARGALVAEQHPMPVGIAAQGARIALRFPVAQHQAEALGRLAPLPGDRGAVAEHHKALQSPLLVQLLKAEQGAEGLAGTRAGMDQHVLVAGTALHQSGAQQLDQLPLPLPGLQGRRGSSGGCGAIPAAGGRSVDEGKGNRAHGPHCACHGRAGRWLICAPAPT